MPKKDRELTSSFGTLWEIWQALVKAVEDAGGEEGHIKWAITDPEAVNKLASQVIVLGNGLIEVSPMFRMQNDLATPLPDLIEGCQFHHCPQILLNDRTQWDADVPPISGCYVLARVDQNSPGEQIGVVERCRFGVAGMRELISYAKLVGDKYPAGLSVCQLGTSVELSHERFDSTYLYKPFKGRDKHPILETLSSAGTTHPLILVRYPDNPFSEFGL